MTVKVLWDLEAAPEEDPLPTINKKTPLDDSERATVVEILS